MLSIPTLVSFVEECEVKSAFASRDFGFRIEIQGILILNN
jgi:hypothetical protein